MSKCPPTDLPEGTDHIINGCQRDASDGSSAETTPPISAIRVDGRG